MESNKLDAGETTSFINPLLQENDIALPCWQNDAANTIGMFRNGTRATADPVSLPHMPLPVGSFDWKDMHGAFQQNTHYVSETCGNAMVDLNQLHSFQKPVIDPCSFNVANTIPCLYGQDLQYPERNVKGTSCIRDVMNDSFDLNRFRDPGIDIRRIPLIRSTIGGGYEQRSGEADVRNISGPQIHNFIGSGGSSTYQTHNSNGPQIKNFVVSGGSKTNNTQSSRVASIVKKDELCAARFGFPNNVDGSFLSLGIGSNPDIKLKSDLSSGEPTGGGLYGAVNPQLNTSHAQQEAVRSFNPGYNFVGGQPSFQNNVGGFSSLGNHVGGWTSSHNNFGVRGGINTCSNTIQYHNAQKPEADMQHGFPASSSKDLAIAGDRKSRYPNLHAYKGFMGRCGSSSSQLLDSGQTAASGLESGSVELSWTTRPTSDQLQNHLAESVIKLSAQSSMVSSLISSKGCSSRQEHSGQLLSTHDIAVRSGADCVMFPKSVGVQVGKDSAPQASGSDLFPQRLGVHVNEYRTAPAARDGLFPKSTGTKGCSQKGSQSHLRKDLIRPSFPTGQPFSTANGSGLSQASDILGVPLPSLKRRAMPPPPRVQRRKVTLPPPIHPYILSSQAAPAPPHIKWQGLDGLPQPIGQRCMLCKRDLSFTPEGPVHQPTVPPSVAVLPCGHTFHDNCLQTITPEDQAKDPPCIPCAIGEI